ncbi:MAG: hypothetical protein M3Z04_15520 [Chloroflexota bacterium]|nr:hypothetical protein [Chloroflexota bacterium]
MMKSAIYTQTAGLLLRALLLGTVCGVATQVFTPLHDNLLKGILWLGALALLLGTARRTAGALWLGVAGALLCGVGTIAYFATHLAILDLGWGPANTADLAHTLDAMQAWQFFQPEIRHWILPITGAGFLIGWTFGAVLRYVPRREAAHVA